MCFIITPICLRNTAPLANYYDSGLGPAYTRTASADRDSSPDATGALSEGAAENHHGWHDGMQSPSLQHLGVKIQFLPGSHIIVYLH